MGVFAVAAGASAAKPESAEKPWIVDRFDDIKVIRYEVPGFESLPLREKELIYYLSEAAKCGRDILFDQNFKYNLVIRHTLERIYNDTDDRDSADFKALEKYLKKMWFANGIHHHYSNDKFRPEFAEKWLREQIDRYVYSDDLDIPVDFLCAILYDPDMYPSRLNQTAGADVILTSANNYYEGVDQQQVEEFYARMAEQHKDDKEPISYGLNSKLMADEEGNVVERVWRVGGMYSPAIEKIVYWLDKAAEVAEPVQRRTIEALAKYYRTGDLNDFDAYNILWVKDLESNVDFVNGFIEDYGDPLGRKASWEANVNFRDEQACRRTEIISANAQWFEDNSPVDPAYKKKTVKGVSAKVITVAMLGGDCYPATPIGINLPNADWIRKEYGSKSVTIDNITYAYDKAPTATVSRRSSFCDARTANAWTNTASWPTTCTPTCTSAWVTARDSWRPAPRAPSYAPTPRRWRSARRPVRPLLSGRREAGRAGSHTLARRGMGTVRRLHHERHDDAALAHRAWQECRGVAHAQPQAHRRVVL